jgi:hypothetical protein
MISSDQTFRDLTTEDCAWLADQRARTEKFIEGNEDARQKYETAVGKLGTIRAVLDAKCFRPDQTFELQGLGIILGDVFSSEMGMKWQMVEDASGVSPCLVMEGTSIIIYPQTMISKRMERGETVDVFDLFNGVCGQIDEFNSKWRLDA